MCRRLVVTIVEAQLYQSNGLGIISFRPVAFSRSITRPGLDHFSLTEATRFVHSRQRQDDLRESSTLMSSPSSVICPLPIESFFPNLWYKCSALVWSAQGIQAHIADRLHGQTGHCKISHTLWARDFHRTIPSAS